MRRNRRQARCLGTYSRSSVVESCGQVLLPSVRRHRNTHGAAERQLDACGGVFAAGVQTVSGKLEAQASRNAWPGFDTRRDYRRRNRTTPSVVPAGRRLAPTCCATAALTQQVRKRPTGSADPVGSYFFILAQRKNISTACYI